MYKRNKKGWNKGIAVILCMTLLFSMTGIALAEESTGSAINETPTPAAINDQENTPDAVDEPRSEENTMSPSVNYGIPTALNKTSPLKSQALGEIMPMDVNDTEEVDGIKYVITEMPGAGNGKVKVGNNQGFTGTALTIPNEITVAGGNAGTYDVVSIGAGAFYQCTSLTSVSLPATPYVIEHDSGSYGAFEDCTSLTDVDLSRATSIGSYTFLGCTSLTDVDLRNGVIIGANAFSGCTSLTVVYLSTTFPVGAYAFGDCTSLTDVYLTDVWSIGDYTFRGCSSLTDVNLSNVSSIGNNAFSSCTSLAEIDLSNVIYIGNNAFYGCLRLDDITLPTSTPTAIGNNFLYGCALDFTDMTKYPAWMEYEIGKAHNQIPKVYFDTTSSGSSIGIGDSFDPKSAYTLKTKYGTDYLSLDQNDYSWLSNSIVWGSYPEVTVSGTYDTGVAGIYDLKFELDPGIYANTHELSYQLRVGKFLINYNANGGSGTMDSVIVTPGDDYDLSLNTFTFKDHSFTGWNTEADGSGKAFRDGATITNILGDIDLYAQWQKNKDPVDNKPDNDSTPSDKTPGKDPGGSDNSEKVKGDQSRTWDDSNSTLWIIMGLLSMLVLLSVLKRKKILSEVTRHREE